MQIEFLSSTPKVKWMSLSKFGMDVKLKPGELSERFSLFLRSVTDEKQALSFPGLALKLLQFKFAFPFEDSRLQAESGNSNLKHYEWVAGAQQSLQSLFMMRLHIFEHILPTASTKLHSVQLPSY